MAEAPTGDWERRGAISWLEKDHSQEGYQLEQREPSSKLQRGRTEGHPKRSKHALAPLDNSVLLKNPCASEIEIGGKRSWWGGVPNTPIKGSPRNFPVCAHQLRGSSIQLREKFRTTGPFPWPWPWL